MVRLALVATPEAPIEKGGAMKPKPIDEPWFFFEVLAGVAAIILALGVSSGVLPLMLVEWIFR